MDKRNHDEYFLNKYEVSNKANSPLIFLKNK